jgi:hypothetical protein
MRHALILALLLAGMPASAMTLQQDCRGPGSIGTALMNADGTITLNIRNVPGGPLDGVLAAKPGDPNYARILSHVGGMSPGEKKSVPPWC